MLQSVKELCCLASVRCSHSRSSRITSKLLLGLFGLFGSGSAMRGSSWLFSVGGFSYDFHLSLTRKEQRHACELLGLKKAERARGTPRRRTTKGEQSQQSFTLPEALSGGVVMVRFS